MSEEYVEMKIRIEDVSEDKPWDEVKTDHEILDRSNKMTEPILERVEEISFLARDELEEE